MRPAPRPGVSMSCVGNSMNRFCYLSRLIRDQATIPFNSRDRLTLNLRAAHDPTKPAADYQHKQNQPAHTEAQIATPAAEGGSGMSAHTNPLGVGPWRCVDEFSLSATPPRCDWNEQPPHVSPGALPRWWRCRSSSSSSLPRKHALPHRHQPQARRLARAE
jgi:hypothetical protein